MSRKYQWLLFALLSVGTSVGHHAVGQTVDPCQYGCPKSGCPQCPPEGGPIEPKVASDNACMQLCKDENRIAVKFCNYPEKEPAELRECLAKARSNFDACKTGCGK